jgi:hypothetical protein
MHSLDLKLKIGFLLERSNWLTKHPKISKQLILNSLIYLNTFQF